MKDENFHRSITVAANAPTAFERIAQVPKWWATHFEGSAEGLNQSFTVRFGATFVSFRVTEFVPGKKMVWLVTDCNLHWLEDKKEWTGTEIQWALSETGAGTRIDFTHVGLVPALPCYENCSEGWSFYVEESLLKLIEQGKGLPETPKAERTAS